MAVSDTIDAQRANRRLIRESMSAPLLSREHELDLARRWRHTGDEKALHELIQSYMRLVISTASRFKNYGLPQGDLVQEGVNGFIYPFGDTAALAARLRESLADRKRLATMGRESRRIIEGWGFEQNLAGLKSALARLVPDRGIEVAL